MLAWMSDTGMQPPSGTEKHCTKRAPQHHFPAGLVAKVSVPHAGRRVARTHVVQVPGRGLRLAVSQLGSSVDPPVFRKLSFTCISLQMKGRHDV